MTNEQKRWLDAHPDYAPVGVHGGFASFQERGVLTAGGYLVKGQKVAQLGTGAFEVGKRTLSEPGQKPQRL